MAEATKTRTTKGDQSAPPRNVNKHPARVEAQARLEALKLQRDEFTARIEGHQTALTAARCRRTKEQAAAELLDGGCIDDLVAESKAEDLQRWHEQREVLAAAAVLAEKHVTAVETRLSAEVIAGVLPEYHELIERQRAAVLALVEVLQEEDEFIARLHDNGVLLGKLTRVTCLNLSNVVDRFNWFAREARGHYGIEIPELPERY